MRSEWPRRRLAELTVNFDTRRRPVKEAERVAGPYPYYGASGIVDHVDGYLFDGEYLLIAEDGENLRTRNTPIAFRAVGKFWVNNHAHIVQGNRNTSTRFLEYAVLAADIGSYLTGAVMPKLTQANLNKIEVHCPTRAVQDEIVGVLGALDDRIDLLRRTNATLESIAQALFKSWFIDFDPVRAKAEGREPEGMDAATATLFPAEFEESALGSVPMGWRTTTIEEVAAKVGMGPFGSNIKVSTFVDSGVPVLTGSSLKATLLEDEVFRCITPQHAERLAGSLVEAGDIVITHRGTLGQVALVPVGAKHPAYMLSQSQFYLRVDERRCTSEFMTYYLRSAEGQHRLLANASQVGVPSISRPVTYLKSVRLTVPPLEVTRAFSGIVQTLHLRVTSGRSQIAVLQQLRDTLLPRLISGKLRLPKAEEQVEAALA